MLEELPQPRVDQDRPIAKPANIVFTQELPKTRSGKIMRRLLRDVAENRPLGDTTTLADPTVVEEIRDRSAGGEDDNALEEGAHGGTRGFPPSQLAKQSGKAFLLGPCSNGPMSARFNPFLPITSCATRCTSSTVTASS